MFAGQRFCRGCGASTDQLDEEQTPTQIMPSPPAEWGVRSADTAPTPGQETSPVYAPPQYYQPSVPPMIAQPMPPYQPPRRRSPLGWIIAFIGMGLFVALILVVIFISQKARRALDNIPRDADSSRPEARSGEIELTALTADQVDPSGNQTTLTKTFELDDHAKFELRNISGSIVVQAWDEPTAEVKVIKQGLDRGGRVFFTSTNGSLSIRSARNGGQDVRYEVKLPKELGRVTLSSTNGSIKLSDVSGQIFIEGGNGSIELIDVTGVSKVQTSNGRIKAVLQEASEGPMEFAAKNGSIDLTIKSDFDADLEASTMQGSINIDDKFGIPVEKELVGQRARGQIGSGGQLLKINTVNGSIKLSK